MTLSSIARLVLTAGEPAGIGPDLCVQIAQRNLPCRLTVIADRDVPDQRALKTGATFELREDDPTMFSLTG
ncbi:MAG: hypothetical protein P0107_00970 [Nitrosomonas sp.]|nr:hypothetical protein [Nitrosomonas sp.]